MDVSFCIALVIIAGLQEMFGASVVLVTPKEGPKVDPHDPDALCCLMTCPSCPRLGTGTFDHDQTFPESVICKCDPLCTEYGDCCPDYSDRCSTGQSNRWSRCNDSHVDFECVKTSRRTTEPYSANFGFYMVSSCIGSTDWGMLDGLCRTSRPNFERTYTRQLNATMRTLPVASNVTGLHYRNIYCALCNRAPTDSLVPWTAWFESPSPAPAEVYNRYWFEPPSEPSLDNISRPRDCLAAVTISDPTSKNSSIAEECRRTSSMLDPKERQCLVCEIMLSKCFGIPPDFGSFTLQIPFDFPSFVEQTEHSFLQTLSCPDRFFFDPKQQRCVRIDDPIDPGSSSGAFSCNYSKPKFDIIWMRVHVSNPVATSWREILREDIMLSFGRASGIDVSDVQHVSLQRRQNTARITPPLEIAYPPNRRTDVTAFSIHLSSAVHGGLNSSSAQSLSSVAGDLLARQADCPYRVLTVQYLLPCGNYSIEQCIADISNTVTVDPDEITTLNGTFYYNTSTMSYRSQRLLRRITFDFRNLSEGHTLSEGHDLSERSHLLLCNKEEHLNCPSFHFDPDEFIKLDGGGMRMKRSCRELHPGEYVIASDGRVQVCAEFLGGWLEFDCTLEVLYTAGTVVSLVGLLLTFITYWFLPSLRTAPGVGTMNLLVATFVAQLGLLLGGRAASTVPPGLCTALAVLLHYAWLASFFWTSCLALGLSRTLGDPVGMRQQPKSGMRSLKLNALYGWGGPLLITTACLIVNFAGNQNRVLLVYGTENVCWIRPKEANLVAFGAPVLISTVANVAMFAKAVKGVRASKRATKCLKPHTTFVRRAWVEMAIYVKISLLMGFSWFWGFLGAFTNIRAFWFIFVICNSFQGAYIFMAFVCSPRVLRTLRLRLRGRGDQSRAPHQTTRLAQSSRMTRLRSTSNRSSNSTGQ